MITLYKKLKLVIMALLLVMSSSVWAAFVKNMPQTFNQPNGKAIHIFASGDEYYNWLHDADNFTIVQNIETGYYVYAIKVAGKVAPSKYIVGQVNPKSVGLTPNTFDDESIIRTKVEERKAARKVTKARFKTEAAASPQVRPGTGVYNNVVVYIQFSDQDGSSLTRSESESKFNGAGVVSVKDYYNEVSAGQLNVTSSFYPTTAATYPVYYKDSHPRSYYCKNTPDGYGDNGTADREHLLLKNAIDAVSSQVPTSLNIDGNSDGFVDNVTFIINGNTEGWAELLWPHRWSLFTQTAMIGSKQVYDYNIVFTSALGVGVISHEMFHSFGAPDLYEYNNWSGITPVGSWDVMASNDWNLPQHMSVYLKSRYGTWTSIPEITASGNYSLNPVSSTNPFGAYKIKLPNSTENEYIVLEYRKREGRYEGVLSGADGLLIYRVNENGNNPSGPKHEVYVYRKDGTPTVDGDLYNASLNQARSLTTFNDNSNPKAILGNGLAAGFTGTTGISNVNVTATGLTFTYTAPNSGSSCTDPAWSATATYTSGMKVTYNGRTYTANYWTLNNRPDLNCCAAGEEWTDNGACATNVAPTVSISSPVNNSNIVSGTSVTISASAADQDGTVSRVDFLNSSNAVVYSATASPFNYVIGSSLAVGSYTYKAIAYDNKGAASAPATVTFTIVTATNPPVVTITSPVQNQVFYNYPSDGNQVTVTLNTVPATLDSVKYILVETICNGPGCTHVRRFTTTTAPYSLVYTPNYSATGWTQVTAIGFKNGVSSDGSAQTTYYVKPLPELTIVSPADNAIFPKTTTTIPVDVTVNSNIMTIDSVVYTVTDTKVVGQSATTTTRKFVVANPYDLNLPVVSGNTYTKINVLAYGDGGKFSRSKMITVTYNQPPVITITAPLPVNGINPKYVVGGSITVSANVSDPDGSIAKVEFTHGSGLGLITVTQAPYTATFTNLPSPAPDGSYWLTVKAYDNEGGVSTSVVSIFKNRVPTVSITSPVNNATVTIGSNLTISTLVYDPDFTSGKVEFFNGTTKLGEVTSSPYNFTISNIAAGTYNLTAKVTDDMGESGTSSLVTITVPAGGCSAPQYVQNGGYVAGSRVKNNGVQYECKGYPYTAWCNGASWAYAPGTGSYWSDAWIQIGTCRSGSFAIEETAVQMYPNPASQSVNLNYASEGASEIVISLVNEYAQVVYSKTSNVSAGDNALDIDLSRFENGLYLLRIEDAGKIITKKLSVVK